MNNKLPCELIRDLFPSYIDGLTSEVTNRLVQAHIDECPDCKGILEAMREPSVEASVEAEAFNDRKEIDFLKTGFRWHMNSGLRTVPRWRIRKKSRWQSTKCIRVPGKNILTVKQIPRDFIIINSLLTALRTMCWKWVTPTWN